MLTNLHTHTTFCDGKNPPEEIVLTAIKKGFNSLGFSGHVYTREDSACMKDADGYAIEIKRLKQKYKDQIEIYLGIEEDVVSLANRVDYDFIIGSSHFFSVNGKIIPIDLDCQTLKGALKHFDDDPLVMAEEYYRTFCDYICKRKPDIVGHFDLITKFEEVDTPLFLGKEKYLQIAKKYLKKAMESDCYFEVNTGAMARGYRTAPYPEKNLLAVLKDGGAKLVLTSDCHDMRYIDFGFIETRKQLKQMGFECVYTLSGGSFIKDYL